MVGCTFGCALPLPVALVLTVSGVPPVTSPPMLDPENPAALERVLTAWLCIGISVVVSVCVWPPPTAPRVLPLGAMTVLISRPAADPAHVVDAGNDPASEIRNVE